MKKAQQIKLDDIRIDGGTQPRGRLDEVTVDQYAEAVDALPPVDVYFDGTDRWLADGFHRYFGHKKAGAKTMPAIVHKGTKRDAILHSVGANATHGLRRTNEDKRRAVGTLLADAEWAKWSARKIAETCGVTHTFVNQLKAEQSGNGFHPDRKASTAKGGAKLEPAATVTAKDADPSDAGTDIDNDDTLAGEVFDEDLADDADGVGRPTDGPTIKDASPADPASDVDQLVDDNFTDESDDDAPAHQSTQQTTPPPQHELKPERPSYMGLTDAMEPLVARMRALITEMERTCGRQKKRGEPDFTADGTFYLTPRHFDNLRNGVAHILDALPAGPKNGNPGYINAAHAKTIAASSPQGGKVAV